MKQILVINGPNLNLLGIRENSIYGNFTLESLYEEMKQKGEKYDFSLDFFQSNHEGNIIDKIQQGYGKYDYLIINPGAFTHYSIGIRDAITAVGIKTIEVHISNIYKREEFRKISLISDISEGTMAGFGKEGYLMALEYINLKEKEGKK